MQTFLNKYLLGSIILVLIFTIAIYSNHFHNAFHFDDSHSVENNTYIRNIKNIPLFFTDGTTSSVLPTNQSYRPVVSTSLAIDYWLGGGYNLFYFHLSMFILFLCQGLLMLFLYNKVYQKSGFKSNTIYIALIAAAWYMVHPAIAETVNYIIARSDLISTFCILAAFVLYLYSPFSKRTYLYLLPVVVGALAKPPSVMFAPLLFVYILFFEEGLSLHDVFKAQNINRLISVFKKSLPSFILCAMLYLLISKLTPATWVAGGSSAMLYIITQPFIILHYFITLFVPTGLSADSDWSLLPGVGDIRFFVGAAFIVVMLWIAIYTSKKALLRPISFGIIWFFLALLPTSVVPLAEVLNDHRMYFPFVGLILSVSWAIALVAIQILKNAKVTVTYALIPVLLLLPLYGYGTYKRNQVWQTEESLWHNVAIKSPLNGRGLMNYGLTQMGKGNYAAAEQYFTRALQLLPNYYALDCNMGVLKEAGGDAATAENYYKKAMQEAPDNPGPYYFYGRFLLNQVRYPEAEQQLLRSISLSTADMGPRMLLMNVYENTENWPALKQLAEASLQLSPGDVPSTLYLRAANNKKGKLAMEAEDIKAAPTAQKYLDLSLQYYQIKKYQQCIDACNEAIKLKPDFAEAYNNIGTSYNALKQYDKAIPALQKAIALKPDFQLAKNNLAAAKAVLNPSATATSSTITADDHINLSLKYYNEGNYQKCIDECDIAVSMRPTSDLPYNNMCAAYNRLGQYDKAIKAGEKGLKLNPNNQLLKNNLQEAYNNVKK